MLSDSRMNVAGIMPNNVDYVAEAFAAESGSLQHRSLSD
jgi:aspartate/tyrosine/aromatic aminotransferase